MLKPKKPNKKRLLKLYRALKSGKYAQTVGTLCRTANHSGLATKQAGFCCLGVACEVAIENGLALEKFESKDRIKYGGEYGESSYMPKSVREWYGFESKNPTIVGEENHGGYRMSELNDHEGLDFKQIAEKLKEHYKLTR